MPFIATNLSVLSATNGFTLWHYRTTDTRDQVQAADYFAPAITLAANPQRRAIILDPMPEAIEPGASIPVGASIIGSITNLTFQLLNAAGTLVATQNTAVSAARATVLFPAQAPGGGYRIIARNSADTAHSITSPPFAIGAPPRLLTEEGRVLLLETGGQLLLF